jgi:nitric oxide reductase large subunit
LASICRPSCRATLLHTWHLQLAIFWIATAYVGGALFVAGSLAFSAEVLSSFVTYSRSSRIFAIEASNALIRRSHAALCFGFLMREDLTTGLRHIGSN